jgi:hypothetical protein
MQEMLTDKLSDVEYSADEWELPSPKHTAQPRCLYMEQRSEYRIPSPLIHLINEEAHLSIHNYLLPYCCKDLCNVEDIEELPASISIVKRIRHRLRVSIQVIKS